MARHRKLYKRAKAWGRGSSYSIGNGAGRGRWARGTAKRRSLHGRNYQRLPWR